METIIRNLATQVDTLTNTVLALEQRVTLMEDQAKDQLEHGLR